MSEFYAPSECEREGAPRAFKYELQMFRWCVQMFECFKNPCSILLNDGIRNSILETALLHTRNLLDFFAGKPSLKDDIIATHFVGNPLKLPYLESLREDINKSLSHLTYTRIRADYRWELPKIKDEIEAAYTEFIKLLPEKDRAKWPSPEGSGTN